MSGGELLWLKKYIVCRKIMVKLENLDKHNLHSAYVVWIIILKLILKNDIKQLISSESCTIRHNRETSCLWKKRQINGYMSK